MYFKGITNVMGWRALVARLYSPIFLKLDNNEDERLKNIPMGGENGVHMKHVKIPFEKKTNCLP